MSRKNVVNRNNMLLLLVLLLCLLLSTSCKTATAPETYSVTGTVFSDIDTGIEGVTVLIYNLIPLNESVSELSESYPNHGADLDLYNGFDHRTNSPIAVCTTASNGTFNLSGIAKGIYNLVAFKEGFGFTYLLNFSVSGNSSGVQLALAPVVSLQSPISEDLTLESNRIYSVASDLILLPGNNITVGSNSVLIISPGVNLDLYGKLVTSEDSSLKIMSSDLLYSYSNPQDQIKRFSHLSFKNQSNSMIQNVIVINSNLGIQFIGTQNFTLKNSFVKALYYAVDVTGSDNFTLNKCSITGSTDIGRGAAYFENDSNIVVERCHFYDNKIGIYIAECPNASVKNNSFDSNGVRDMSLFEGSVAVVEFNTFRGSQIAIYNYRGQVNANYNDIQAVIGIHSLRVNAWFSAKFNNLNCSQYGIKSQCMFYNSSIIHLDGTRNYWNTTDISAIEQLVWDRDNESEDDENYSLLKSIVDFQPISITPNTAGIFN
ncbi:MAG: right-handed parallel beta-helix repeat-containing protein [Candidatus Cloacimonetes bacterium]|nr:right-handed parallel beta-helix repeat-containing protein [Candidatus Cloacimonadota bacterium]